VSPHLYTAKSGWYRDLVVETDDGLVVVDPMGPRMVPVLQDGIARNLSGKKVKTLFYTHYHLDHAAGGAPLGATDVIGHEKCTQYWSDLGAKDVVPINHPISGDQTLNIGGVEIRALYLGHSHTDTLYALYFPAERVLFTADLGLVKTVPPVGVPDSYWPGYMAALDRVAALDFDTFVPSHFGWGKKQDLLDCIELLKTERSLARDALARHKGQLGGDGAPLEDYFDEIYPQLEAKYGEWHGFGAMFIPNMSRDVEGELLGF